ncbi:uridylate-specific endoribonuclease-like [Antedon mediterranea]|uniref:uridylate-specific endoribonuclease-like n=1 Tax=Antedon mediterranea TaxID=105859 RepID=UPI003AF56183
MKTICILLVCAVSLTIVAAGDSCSGRCDSGFSGSYDCQCNTHCVNYGDCCADYSQQCLGSPTDLQTLADALWSGDVNRADSKQFTVNKQTFLSNTNDQVDRSSAPLLSYVDSSLLSKDTYAKFIALLDNYEARTGIDDSPSLAETREKDAFVSAILSTNVMELTYDFLFLKGKVSSKQDFQAQFEDMWFKSYSRSSPSDTSGFEHVFVGEQKSSSVSGFHNWIQLNSEENNGALNYYGYSKEASPNLLLFQFSWDGKIKKLSSIMFGASPEFEMALFTTCFLTERNNLCSFKLDGNNVDIQTYDYKGESVIGSAYFSV